MQRCFNFLIHGNFNSHQRTFEKTNTGMLGYLKIEQNSIFSLIHQDKNPSVCHEFLTRNVTRNSCRELARPPPTGSGSYLN